MSVAMMKRINLLNTRWQYHFDPVLVLFEIFRIASCVSLLLRITYRFIAASLTASLCVTLLAEQASAADGKTFRWSSAGDFLTFDVHAQNGGRKTRN